MESMNARKKIGTKTHGNKAKDWLSGCRRKAGCRWQPSQGVNLGTQGEKAGKIRDQAIFDSSPSSGPNCVNWGK